MEQVARDAYGRVLARLAYQWRDIQAAEDALGDALALALTRWPRDGAPASPEAWLLTTARNQLRQAARHHAVTARHDTVAALVHESEGDTDTEPLGDHRLRLMFVCAHPAIDEASRTPLMLQVVLGLDATVLARAFLVSSSSMSQRLVRAKRKIRDAGIPFETPEANELPARISAVIEGVYAAFTRADSVSELADESMYLARVLVNALPDEPDALALLALMMFVRARASAASNADGDFVPLHQQDTALWDRAQIIDAELLLRKAATMRRPGPFQLEAAIHSAHCQRLFSGVTPWRAIEMLYRALNQLAPTVGSLVAQAIAAVENHNATAADEILDGIEPSTVEKYAPYWVAKAHVARARGAQTDEAHCLKRALSAVEDAGQQRYLAEQLARLQ